MRGRALTALAGRGLGVGALGGRVAPLAGEGVAAAGEEGEESSPAAALDPRRGGRAAGRGFLVMGEAPLVVAAAAAAGAYGALLPLPRAAPRPPWGGRARPSFWRRLPTISGTVLIRLNTALLMVNSPAAAVCERAKRRRERPLLVGGAGRARPLHVCRVAPASARSATVTDLLVPPPGWGAVIPLARRVAGWGNAAGRVHSGPRDAAGKAAGGRGGLPLS